MTERSTTRDARLPGRALTRRGVLWVGLLCDLRCKFCYDHRLAEHDKSWVAFDDAVQTLDKFRFYYDNRAVDFMGGEPTLHPRMLDMVRYAASVGLRPTVVTHGMLLAAKERAEAYARAGIVDFLVSIHGVGATAGLIHGRGTRNHERQMQALDNLRAVGIPFRFNVTVIRDNLGQLDCIAQLAGDKGADVVNFLTFNPYFEWSNDTQIEFQPRHSEAAPYLIGAIDRCSELGIEANVRYMPPCQLQGYERHLYTGFQLPFDQHEWDYNSWYDSGHQGVPSVSWYRWASERQRVRNGYVHVSACSRCSMQRVCDGFHTQYVARWGGDEAVPYRGEAVDDPVFFVKQQAKAPVEVLGGPCLAHGSRHDASPLRLPQFRESGGHRAGVTDERMDQRRE